METTHGFTLLQEQFVPELNTLARLYRHVKTGAELLSLQNEDENKSFGITFRTPHDSSTGIAHIMEHSVLCGSRKYPVKEPFIELVKGSFKTFLNAMTFPDMTTYPVASTNLQDFYNLVDVYLDAVFYPLIPPHILEQEGWHFELDRPDAPLGIKGVVYNEMKGAYSSPDELLYEHSKAAVFPDTLYRHDSGGNPRDIPDLTYEDFRDFHATYYHPSNSRIYFYGDDDPAERLRLMDAYLRDFDPIAVDSQVPLQPRLAQPRTFAYGYDAGEGDTSKKAMVTVNWLLTDDKDPALRLALNILDHILIGTPASPLRKALLDSGLGEDLVGGGLQSFYRQVMYSIGLRGTAAESAAQIEQLVLSVLAGLAEQGLDPAAIEASLNTIEFRLRENNTGSFPRGLSLMFRALSTWNYDSDPIAPLFFDAHIQTLRDRMAAGERVFEGLIQTWLVDNLHRSLVTLHPDPAQKQAIQEQEQARLQAALAAMTPADLAQVAENTRKLKEIQETPDSAENLAKLPFLQLSDIDPKIRVTPGEFEDLAGRPVYFHDLFTNGLFYLDLAFEMSALPPDLLPYLPLFSRALMEMGTQRQDFVRLTQQIGSKTGGIFPGIHTAAVVGEKGQAAYFVVRAKSTVAQVPDLLALLQEILLEVRLDNPERFRQLALKSKAGKEAGLVPGGNAVVVGRLRAHFHPSDRLGEELGGVNNLFFTRTLVEELLQDWPTVLAKLEQIRARLVNRAALLANVTLDAQNWAQVRPQLARFVEALPAAAWDSLPWNLPALPDFEALTIPSQVNFVGKGLNLYAHGYTFHGAALVALRYLRTTWLWEQVRVKGGAYGGSVAFDRVAGTLAYFSYRDPNLLGTLANYDQSGPFLNKLDLSASELTRTIIGTVSDLDAYQLPDAKGYGALLTHLSGITSENRQLVRDQVLATTAADVRRFGEALDLVRDHGHIVVMGSPDAVAAASAERGAGWLHVTKVL